MDKTIDNEFSIHMGKFYILHVYVVYSPCSKLPFSEKHAKCQLSDN